MGLGFGTLIGNDGMIVKLVNEIPEALYRTAKTVENTATGDFAQAGEEAAKAAVILPTAAKVSAGIVYDATLLGFFTGNEGVYAAVDYVEYAGAKYIFGAQRREGPNTPSLTQLRDDAINNGLPGFGIALFSGKRPTDHVTEATGIPLSHSVPMEELITALGAKLKDKGFVTPEQYNQALRETVEQFKREKGENVAFLLKPPEGAPVQLTAIYSDEFDSRKAAPITNFMIGSVMRNVVDKDAKTGGNNFNIVDNLIISKSVSVSQLKEWVKTHHPEDKDDVGKLFTRYLQEETPATAMGTALTDDHGHLLGTLPMASVGVAFPGVEGQNVKGKLAPAISITPPPEQPKPTTGTQPAPTQEQPAPGADKPPPEGFFAQAMQIVGEHKMLIGAAGIAAAIGTAMLGLWPLALLGAGAASLAFASGYAKKETPEPITTETTQTTATDAPKLPQASELGTLHAPSPIRGQPAATQNFVKG